MKNITAKARILVSVALLTYGGGVCSPVKAEETGSIDDQDISSAIQTELVYDNHVTANEIDVETRDGIVSLNGTVDNILEKERAEEITAAIRGVRSVINQVHVVPESRLGDAELKTHVEQALLEDPAADAYELTVSVQAGIVTLEGPVESFAEKQLSADVAKGVDGVIDLINSIRIEYADERSDAEIRADVLAVLENDIRVDDLLVDVSVEKGIVTLSGIVGSLQEKNQAYLDAWVAGVQSVDSDTLEIRWWARDDLRRTATAFPRENTVVREAIKDAFMYDPRVSSPDIDVDVRNGVVRLSGVVNDLRTRHAAKEDALNTLGVQRVINNIKVRPDIPADEELKQRVSARFLRDPLVNRFDIQIDVRQGWVTLRGEVETSYIKKQAELAARAVKGVVGVLNKLDFRLLWIWMPDRELEAAVEDRLYWSALIGEENITVFVRNGVVTLTGTVASWNEFDEAEKKAYQAGAKHVVNKLKVENPSYHGPYGPVMYSPYHNVQLLY